MGLVAIAVGWFVEHLAGPAPELKQFRLTSNTETNPVVGAVISLDGKYLAYSDQAGLHVRVIETGETHTILLTGVPSAENTAWSPVARFPDATQLLVNKAAAGPHPSIWVVSVFGGTPQRLRLDATAKGLSPDGSEIVFTASPGSWGDREIWAMGLSR